MLGMEFKHPWNEPYRVCRQYDKLPRHLFFLELLLRVLGVVMLQPNRTHPVFSPTEVDNGHTFSMGVVQLANGKR